MKMKKLLLTVFICLNSSISYACINTYVFDLGRDGIDKKTALEKLKNSNKKPKTYKEMNDYGVLLIYSHQYDSAIKIFKDIETKHPLLAKTAANLGTAYELKGDLKKATYWIGEGIKRDSNIHEGSEWIHLKILDAQMEQQRNPNWIRSNDVLGLDFGDGAAPHVKVKMIQFNQQNYNLEKILAHSKIQMDQRLRFVEKDPITAQILFNMANIEVIQMSREEDAAPVLYSTASRLGYSHPELLEIRKNYILTSKWYAFKRFFAEITHFFRHLMV